MEIRHNNGWPAHGLQPPHYLIHKRGAVVHLVEPGSIPLASRLVEGGSFEHIQRGSGVATRQKVTGQSRCDSCLYVADAVYYETMPKTKLRICARCAKSTQASLRDFIKDNLICWITRGLSDRGIPLIYRQIATHLVGSVYTKDVTVATRAPDPGSIRFKFMAYERPWELDVPLLNMMTWEWYWGDVDNRGIAAWIADQLDRRVKNWLSASVAGWQEEGEEGLFAG